VHSATKYLDGQGRCIGGAVVGSEKLVGTEVYGVLRTAGPSMSPFNAWVFLKGLETLDLRMRAHSESALHLAQWLEHQPAVERVYYTGLASHPQFELARTQQSDVRGVFLGGGVLAFDIRGGQPEAWKIIDATRMLSITANLGDTKTTITHPATTTHSRVTAEARAAAGIKDSLIRIAVGLEDIEDIKRDLQRGFDAIR
jgi:O-succinylhomoserine sulfhydrylase